MYLMDVSKFNWKKKLQLAKQMFLTPTKWACQAEEEGSWGAWHWRQALVVFMTLAATRRRRHHCWRRQPQKVSENACGNLTDVDSGTDA